MILRSKVSVLMEIQKNLASSRALNEYTILTTKKSFKLIFAISIAAKFILGNTSLKF